MNGPGCSLSPRQLLGAACEQQAAASAQRRRWDKGFTRRSFLTGSGFVVASTLGSQLVTSRHAYAAAGASNGKTLVVVFLRGGLDGLGTVVPRNDPILTSSRGQIGIPDSKLLSLNSSAFGLHPSLSTVLPLYQQNKLAFVHAVGATDSNRDHFASQSLMERGTSNLSWPTGWLDRVLELDGPGTTFRAVSEGPTVPKSLLNTTDAVAMKGIDSLVFSNPDPDISDAMRTLYTGLDSPLESLMVNTLGAVAAAPDVQRTPKAPQNGAVYSADDFGAAMADIARLVRSGCGLRVATVDVGGWDVHSEAGNVDAGTMTNHLRDFGKTVSAFATDLGSRLSDVTVVFMSEFGRRVAQNGSGGTDHGFGGLMMLLGGSVIGGRVAGAWPGLGTLPQGDLPVANDYRDVLGEAAQKTLGLGSISSLFPQHTVNPIGLLR